jgi:hypothetical protein
MRELATNHPDESAQLPEKCVKSLNGILNMKPRPIPTIVPTQTTDGGQQLSTAEQTQDTTKKQ